MVYDFTKSILVDCHCMQYMPSLIVTALISASTELCLHLLLENDSKAKKSHSNDLPIVEQLQSCIRVWDEMVKKLYGSQAAE